MIHRPATEKSGPISIACGDGFELGGFVFAPSDDCVNRQQIAIICPATAVAQTFYFSFAKFLAAHGIIALVYDYRGVGKSRPPSLKGFDASLQHWADDLGAVTRYARRQWPASDIAIVGHSLGGLLALVNPEKQSVTRVVTIGSQMSYWKDWPLRVRYGRALLWHVFFPALTRVFGYLPVRRLNMGEDLPYRFALEWASCWRSRNELLQHLSGDRSLSMPSELVVIGISDDDIATPAAIRALHRSVIARRVTEHWIHPNEHDLPALGHFDLFREKIAAHIWPSLLSLVSQRA